MTTYDGLVSTVLELCDHVGSTDAQTVANRAMALCMRYVSSRVELPSLIGSASFTWGALTTSAPLFTSQGFNITESTYGSPNRLYVKRDSSATDPGIPYEFLEYVHWLDLKSAVSGGARSSLFEPPSNDERPQYAYTIDHSNALIAYPIAENNVLKFYYNKLPAAFAGGATPEIPAQFDYILINGASLYLKEWIREPADILDSYRIFQSLNPQIEEMDSFLNARRKRRQLKLANSYRVY